MAYFRHTYLFIAVHSTYLSNLLREIEEDYQLCIHKPSEYQNKVDSISNMFGLTGKNRLRSDNCPAYVIGKFKHAPIVMFGLNPGYSSKNNPAEEIEARKSWKHYRDYCLNFFQFFSRNKFESPYYTALWQLLSGLTGMNLPRDRKWELFDRYLANIELIPYHSEGITLPSNLTKVQFEFLRRRYINSTEFISQFHPKLIIFNGKIWHTLLINHNLVSNYYKVQITEKFALYFFETHGIPCVLFDKFFQRHFWGITNEDRRILIPNLIHSRFRDLSADLKILYES